MLMVRTLVVDLVEVNGHFFLSWSDIYLQPQFQCQTFERTRNCLTTAGLSSSITNDQLTDQHFEQKL